MFAEESGLFSKNLCLLDDPVGTNRLQLECITKTKADRVLT